MRTIFQKCETKSRPARALFGAAPKEETKVKTEVKEESVKEEVKEQVGHYLITMYLKYSFRLNQSVASFRPKQTSNENQLVSIQSVPFTDRYH